MTDKLKQFEQIVEVLSQDTPSTQEVADLISQIVEVVKQTKDFLEKQAQENKLDLNKHINRVLEEALVRLDGIFTDLEKDTKNKANKAVDEAIQQTKLDLDLITKNLYVELKKMEDSIPSPTDLSEIFTKLAEVESKIPQLQDITGEKVRDSLELLQDDERLDIAAIRGITVSAKRPEEPKLNDIWVDVS